MGLLTRLEIRDQLRVAMGGRTDRPDTELNTYINMGYTLISQPEVRRHEELKARVDVSLATDTDEYDISKAAIGFNILAIRLVEFIDATVPVVSSRRTKLDPRPEEYFSNRTAFGSTGGPRYYMRDGSLLRITSYPLAADNGKKLRLHVYREPEPLADDASTTVLLDYFDNALILAAEYHMKLRLGYRELAINTRQELQSYINQKSDAGETDTDTGSRAELIS